jgi:hypothetical protein
LIKIGRASVPDIKCISFNACPGFITDQAIIGDSASSCPSFTIREITSPPQTLAESEVLYADRQPFVVRGCCPTSSVQGLADLCQQDTSIGEQTVSVHVAPEHVEGRLSFVNKNFVFDNMPLQQLMSALASPSSTFNDPESSHKDGHGKRAAMYLRAVGPNPRKDRADVWRDFKGVAEWLRMSFPTTYVPEHKYFSSVLRLATSGLQLWTHYDGEQGLIGLLWRMLALVSAVQHWLLRLSTGLVVEILLF